MNFLKRGLKLFWCAPEQMPYPGIFIPKNRFKTALDMDGVINNYICEKGRKPSKLTINRKTNDLLHYGFLLGFYANEIPHKGDYDLSDIVEFRGVPIEVKG